MKVYVSIDMEGVAGVVHVDQTRRTGHDYEQARRWMTSEANAAIAGAFDGGATEVLVNDSHADMRNLLLDDLDRRATFILGSLKPRSMVEGGARYAVALFVGYHAGAGSRAAILDHTYHGSVVTGCRVGGKSFNEAAINAAVLGEQGVPVALVTGDAETCAQARETLGYVETVAVKEGITRYAARCLPPAEAQARIRDAAERAVRLAREGTFRPFVPPRPLHLEVDYVNSACADAAELVPGTMRTRGASTAFDAEDAQTMLRVLRAWTILAGSTLT
jgi:D-amino peptidase